MNSLLSICLLAAFIAFSDGANDAPRTRSGTAAARSELRKVLFLDYDRMNIPDDVKVKFGMSLLNLDVNEEKGILEADAWFRISWIDSRLQWDNKTNNVDVLRIGSHEIWKPDVTLYNTANIGEMAKCWDSQPILYPNGNALWVPPCKLSVYCNFTLDEYPLGEQKCRFKFGSWVNDGLLMDLQLYDNTAKADVDYFTNNQWKIVSNVATRVDKYYPCCAEPYPEITFDISIQRIEKPCKN